MSLLHRQLLSSFMKEIEPIVFKTLESAAALAGPAAPFIDEALTVGDAAIRANNPDIGKAPLAISDVQPPVSPFPAAAPAAPVAAAPSPAPTPAPAAAAPVDPLAAVKALIAQQQAALSKMLASLG